MKPNPPTLEEQINFVKGAREILEVEKKATISIDSDNIEMLKAIETI
jgi:hypothetical protein